MSYTVIGIDPGIKGIGFGVVDAMTAETIQGGFVRRPVTGPQRGAELWHNLALQVLSAVDKRNRVDVVAVEMQRSYPHSRTDPNDLIEIGMCGAWVAGILATHCAKGLCSVMNPLASTWKGQVPENIMAERIRGKLTEQELSRIDFPNSKKFQQDVLHGIGLAKWVVLDGGY